MVRPKGFKKKLSDILNCYPIYPPGFNSDYELFSILLLCTSNEKHSQPQLGANLNIYVPQRQRKRFEWLESSAIEETPPEAYLRQIAYQDIHCEALQQAGANLQCEHLSHLKVSKRCLRFHRIDNYEITAALQAAIQDMTIRSHLSQYNGEDIVIGVVTAVQTGKVEVFVRQSNGASIGFSAGALATNAGVQDLEVAHGIGEGVVGIRMSCFSIKWPWPNNIKPALFVATGNSARLKRMKLIVYKGTRWLFFFSNTTSEPVVMDVDRYINEGEGAGDSQMNSQERQDVVDQAEANGGIMEIIEDVTVAVGHSTESMTQDSATSRQEFKEVVDLAEECRVVDIHSVGDNVSMVDEDSYYTCNMIESQESYMIASQESH